MTGKVYLVGAGPGDPGLLTLKAKRLLEEADLIVYDYLANPEHLRHAKPGARTICVGKRFRYHRFSQDKINRLIIDAAQKNRVVVRLKGGDPYLFGRGGEEALYLFKHRVPFEVVPGISSATGCAAYAGIPLTHRVVSGSVTFLTGHRADDDNLDTLDWEKLVGLRGTLVIYMGFYNLAKIAKKLVEKGMPAGTKISVIEWGTLPRQRSCDGTLATIARAVKAKGLKAPCMIVIGGVVSLRRELNWFERLPLFGQKILVTRTRERSGAMREKLAREGAEVIEFPTIEIKPAPAGPIDAAIRALKNFDWVVFTSVHGVEAFFARLKALGRDARAFGPARIAAVGPETAKSLSGCGVSADLIPARFETEALVQIFKQKFKRLDGQKILLLRTDIAPPALEDGLKRLGAEIERVTAYTTRLPKSVPTDIKRRLLGGDIDWVTFTSASTADHFVRMLGKPAVKSIARRARLASIGPVTTKALRAHGLRPACQAKIFTVDGLVAAMKNKAKR